MFALKSYADAEKVKKKQKVKESSSEKSLCWTFFVGRKLSLLMSDLVLTLLVPIPDEKKKFKLIFIFIQLEMRYPGGRAKCPS